MDWQKKIIQTLNFYEKNRNFKGKPSFKKSNYHQNNANHISLKEPNNSQNTVGYRPHVIDTNSVMKKIY